MPRTATCRFGELRVAVPRLFRAPVVHQSAPRSGGFQRSPAADKSLDQAKHRMTMRSVAVLSSLYPETARFGGSSDLASRTRESGHTRDYRRRIETRVRKRDASTFSFRALGACDARGRPLESCRTRPSCPEVPPSTGSLGRNGQKADFEPSVARPSCPSSRAKRRHSRPIAYGRGWFRTSDLSRVKRALSH